MWKKSLIIYFASLKFDCKKVKCCKTSLKDNKNWLNRIEKCEIGNKFRVESAKCLAKCARNWNSNETNHKLNKLSRKTEVFCMGDKSNFGNKEKNRKKKSFKMNFKTKIIIRNTIGGKGVLRSDTLS